MRPSIGGDAHGGRPDPGAGRRRPGVSQARVSKIEHGEISGIDVVRGYVAALGGTLDVVATLGDRAWNVA